MTFACPTGPGRLAFHLLGPPALRLKGIVIRFRKVSWQSIILSEAISTREEESGKKLIKFTETHKWEKPKKKPQPIVDEG